MGLMELDQRVLGVENKVGVDFSIPGAKKSSNFSPKSPPSHFLAHMNTVTTLGYQSIGDDLNGGSSHLTSNLQLLTHSPKHRQ